MATRTDLPAGTSEILEAPLLSWSSDVPDPTALTWLVAVHPVYNRESLGEPPFADPAWTATALVDRGTVGAPRYRLLIPVEVPAAGLYGMWGRVAGGPSASPVRWLGNRRFR
jgi:hypothetical protein